MRILSNIYDGAFLKIARKYKPFTICAKTSILDVWQDPGYASELASKVKDVSFLYQFDNLLLGKTKKKRAKRTSK